MSEETLNTTKNQKNEAPEQELGEESLEQVAGGFSWGVRQSGFDGDGKTSKISLNNIASNINPGAQGQH